MLNKAKCGEITGIKVDYLGIYSRCKKCIHSCQLFYNSLLPESSGLGICGTPWIGKDYTARHFIPLFIKSVHKLLDGYVNYVLIANVDTFHWA